MCTFSNPTVQSFSGYHTPRCCRIALTNFVTPHELRTKDSGSIISALTDDFPGSSSCRQYTSHVTFSHAVNALIDAHHTAWLKCWCTLRLIPIVIHVMRLSDCLFSPFFLTLFTSVCFSHLFFFCLNLDLYPSSSMWTSPGQHPIGILPIEKSGPLANNTPHTGYEPNLFDDFHYSETTEIFLQEQSSDTMPSYLHDAELSDQTIGRALSSPLFIQE